MKRLALALLLILVMVSLVAAGCGEEEESAPTGTATPAPTAAPTVTEAPASTATPTPTATTTEPLDERLSNLLGLTADIESVRFNVTLETPVAPPVDTTIWIKGNKMRTDATMPGLGETISIIDFDAQTMSTVMGGQTITVDIAMAPQSPIATAQSLADYAPTIVDTETIDEKVCTVVEYTMEGVTAKMWLWEEHGFPVKIETTTAEGTVTIQYTDIDFSPIDDSMFELP